MSFIILSILLIILTILSNLIIIFIWTLRDSIIGSGFKISLFQEETKIYISSGNITKYLSFKIVGDGFPKIEKEQEIGVLLINTPNPPECYSGIEDYQVIETASYDFQTVDRDVHEDAVDEVTCIVNNTLLQITNSSSTSTFVIWSILPKGGQTWEMTFNDSTLPLLVECYDTTGGDCHFEGSITIKELLQLPYK